MPRRPTDLEVARAIAYNESLRATEPAELTADEIMDLFASDPADDDIVVVFDEVAAFWDRDSAWQATIGDYDLDCTVGHGRTPLDAIVDLLDQLEG